MVGSMMEDDIGTCMQLLPMNASNNVNNVII
jgi:hypothetical protein